MDRVQMHYGMHPIIEVYTKPPVPGKKLTKDEAGYVAHGPFSCSTCHHFEPPQSGGDMGACRPVGGPVAAGACCDFWNDPKAPLGVNKTGAEYVYVPGAKYTCAECRYFQADQHTCMPVVGRIEPQASCNKWTP